MAKISLANILSGFSLTKINDNFKKIEDALNNSVLFRDNPLGEDNTIKQDIDLNGHKLYNLAAPTGDSHAARLKDVTNAIAGLGGYTANLINFVPQNGITATNVQGAVEEVLSRLTGRSTSLADVDASVASSDNSAAFVAAFAKGRNVYIPDGVWQIATAIDLPDGAYVWGPGTVYRNTAGPIFTATGKANISVVGIGLKGDLNSWALSFKNCTKVRVLMNRCEEIMLIQTDSDTSNYATTATSGMCSDVVVYQNMGVCTGVPNAVSQQFIRILYTQDFSVCLNTARGYRNFILAWGGDYTTDGAAANERKCYRGLIEGNRGSVLAAGIWTAMARDIRINGNKVTGNAFAEGLDAEGSTDITFESNDVSNFADGLAVFGLNRGIKFWNNNVTATSYAFRNASSTFYADYGLVEFDGNTFNSGVASCISWVTGALGRVRLTNNRFENVSINLTDVAAAEIVLMDNELYYDYAPSGIWFVRLGGLTNGYTVQPKKIEMKIKRNLVEWRGSGVSGKRAFGLTSSAVAHFIDIQENTFVGIDEQISYEGSTGAMTVLVKRNIFDTAATYPAVLHGSSAGLTVIWQDNDRSDGLDAYGINTSSAMSAAFFSDASRIWSNTPTNGGVPGWIKRTGVFGPMAPMN